MLRSFTLVDARFGSYQGTESVLRVARWNSQLEARRFGRHWTRAVVQSQPKRRNVLTINFIRIILIIKLKLIVIFFLNQDGGGEKIEEEEIS